MISKELQKERYEQHHNSLDDEGYRSFLENFINPVLEEVKSGFYPDNQILKILDYGSGPEPALCELMRKYASEGYLSDTTEIRGWDPFFAPEIDFYEGGADLVTCLEVAEHFETPLLDMKKMAGCVKNGGFLAIGTMLLPEDCAFEGSGTIPDAFKNWWYRSDSTHVAFYTLDGLKKCAAASGLEFVKAVTDRAFLFRKKV